MCRQYTDAKLVTTGPRLLPRLVATGDGRHELSNGLHGYPVVMATIGGITRSWHHERVDTVLRILDSTPRGLSEEQIVARRKVDGPNHLPEPARSGTLVTFVVMATIAAIRHSEERRADDTGNALRRVPALRVVGVREGKRCEIDSEQLVPGDIVLLRQGDEVPADLRLIQAIGLRVRETVLTGESVPVEKSTRAVKVGAALGDRVGMAYSGTRVIDGMGGGVVVATGSNTEIGRLSARLPKAEVLTIRWVR